jgi:hypothetical protein
MHASALAAGIGVVDEDRLPDALEVLDQQVVHHPVPEIRGGDLAQLGLGGKKADRTAGAIAARHQRLLQIDQVALLLGLEAQGVGGVALIAPAAVILPIEVFQRKTEGDHSPACTAHAYKLLSLLSLFWLPLLKSKFHALFVLGAYSVADQ